MSKRRPPPKDGDAAARPQPNRSGEPINVWVRSEIIEALRKYLETTRPRVSKTAAVEEALEAFLREKGHWPPAEE